MITTKRIAKVAIERQKRMTFFGQANEESNKGITTIGYITRIQYLDEAPKVEKNIPIRYFKKKTNSGVYAPSRDRLEKINQSINDNSNKGFKKSGYVPSNIKKFIQDDEDNISIVLRNFPTYVDAESLKNKFMSHYSSFGNIKKIHILKDKKGNIKNIAFMEFYNSKDALKLLENPKRLIINKQIISIEKNTKKK